MSATKSLQGIFLLNEDGEVMSGADGDSVGNHEGLLIAGKDGANLRFMKVAADGTLRIDPTGTTTQPMSVTSLPLPTGAATQATLATLATETKLEAVRVLLASLDGKDYATEATQATLATETKLEAVRVLLASLDGKDYATQTTLAAILVDTGQIEALLGTIDADTSVLAAVDYATQATLAAVLVDTGQIEALLTTIDADTSALVLVDYATATNQTDGSQKTQVVGVGGNIVVVNSSGQAAIQNPPNLNVPASTLATEATLDSIKDTDGIKKIADGVQLQAGTNIVGKVVITDLVDDVTIIEDLADPLQQRLQTEARLAPGSTVNIGTGIPSDPAALVIDFLTNGGSHDLLVNGSVTPVAFTYTPGTGIILSVQSLLVVFTADDFSFDGVSFGPNSLLTNGIKFETDIGGVVTEIFNIKQNEDFLRVPGRIPLVNNTGPKDVLGVAFEFGGLVKLSAAAGDQLIVTVRDNLTGVKLKYLTATVYGAEV